MGTLLWIIAVVLVVAGIVQLVQGQIALGLVLIVVGFLVGPGGVSIFASTPAAAALLDHPGDSSPDAAIGRQLTVNNAVVTVLVGTVLPFVNGLLVRPTNPAWVKTLLASLIAVVATALSQAAQAD